MHGTLSILPLTLNDVGFDVRGQNLLRHIGLTFSSGGLTVIMGPNGAGKTLLLRLCHGLLQPTSGEIRWNGNAENRHAMVFQRPVLLRRSARANLVHALALRKVPRGGRRKRADAALERFGLLSLADRPARVLSGGEQQRLAIARAWALDPQVLFLDEPSSALDPGATRQIEDAIAAIKSDGVKIVMATHDLGQAKRLADDVVFLNRGQIVEHTPAKDFFEKPRSKEAQAFLRGELLW
jgi:tungstate transport system ATP-binding protein